MAFPSILLPGVFILITLIIIKRSLFNHRYPPGPPGRMVVGNLWQIPAKKPWLAYTKWAKRYGDIMHLQAVNDHIVVLSSVKVVNDLFEKRSRIYSGRPNEDIVAIAEWDFNLGLLNYSDAWRKGRSMYQQEFRPNAIVQLRPALQERVSTFMKKLCKSPEDFMDHIDLLSASLGLKIIYGINIENSRDPLITVAQEATQTIETIHTPSFIAVLKLCPNVMSIPRWVPILGSVRQSIENTRKLLRDLKEQPVQSVQKNAASGFESDGIAPRLIRDMGSDKESIRRIQEMAPTVYAASAGTIMSSAGTFFLAMAKNAHAQKKAQQEIDSLTDRNRLPTLDDRGNLPYVEAIYRETLRWFPALPLGVPHMATQDDIYSGYDIPKGTILISNIWAMTHDEELYPDPDEFKPERFLNGNGNINDILAFGFGRRYRSTLFMV
ncbi:hypothetical protein VNI00_010714 [Paramarasmius palmivorus]|uniref:Cytochrome P450 n=1 Tax=Paramarasmius palmivorus TaxID=297713 RepID=A0AAW0CIF1_9AGAR